MSTKTLACVAAGLLLVLLVLLLPRDDGGRGLAVSAAAAQAGAEDAAVGDLEPAAAGPAAFVAPIEPGPAERLEPGRTLVAAPRPEAREPARGRECVVLVLHDEQPLAGARLLFLRVERLDESLRRTFWGLEGIDAFLEEHGSEAFADEQGRVAVPDPGAGVLLAAAYGDGLFGRETFELDEEQPWRLEVEEDATFLVRVVDGRGAPVGGIGTCARSFSYGSPEVVLRATTDPEGLARLTHARRWLGREDAVLAIDAPLHPPVEQVLPSAEHADEVVQLTLPASASLAVEVVESDGAPFKGSGTLRVSVVPPGHSRRTVPWADGDRTSTSYELAGTVRIPYVQCGAEVSLSGIRTGSSRKSEAFVTAPTSPGATGQARLVLGADHPVCVWRLLDESAAPLAEREVLVQVVRTSSGGSGERSHSRKEEETRRTDGEGLLALDLPGWLEGETRTVHFVDSASDPPRSARVSLDQPLPPGRRELGDVVLEPAPLFVAGWVVGALGEPVPAARLAVERRESWGWWPDSSMQSQADAQGAFSLRVPAVSGDWRITASTEEGSSAAVPFQVGERDVTLRIEALGKIAGRFLIGEPLADGRDSLSLRLESAEQQEEPRTPNPPWAPIARDGAFVSPGLRPGRYCVVLRGPGQGEVLYRSPEVLVNGGRTTELPDVDLRSSVRRLRIEVVPPRPDPALSGKLELRAPDGTRFTSLWWEGSLPELFTLQDPVGAWLSARGYRNEIVEPLLPHNRVELRRAPTVRVRLTGDAPLPDSPYQIGLSLCRPDEHRFDWLFMPFDEDREVVLEGVEPGSVRVVWLLQYEGISGSISLLSTDSNPLQLVEVADLLGEQTVVVRLDRSELEALLEKAN